MSNTSRREKEEIRTEILDTFDNKIEVSGYSEMERRKIMRRGNLSFEKLLDLEKKVKKKTPQIRKHHLRTEIPEETSRHHQLV